MSEVDAERRRPELRELEPRIHRMLAHPLRYKIIMLLGESEASIGQLADRTGAPPDKVSDQIRILVKEGLIEFAYKKAGEKGGISHFYRSSRRHFFDTDEWAEVPQFERETASVTIAKHLTQEVYDSLEAGDFDSHEDRCLLRLPIWTDSEGVEEVARILVRALDEIGDVELRAAERRTDSEEKPIRLITGLLSFPEASPCKSSRDK